jgi:hypothetical protein
MKKMSSSIHACGHQGRWPTSHGLEVVEHFVAHCERLDHAAFQVCGATHSLIDIAMRASSQRRVGFSVLTRSTGREVLEELWGCS